MQKALAIHLNANRLELVTCDGFVEVLLALLQDRLERVWVCFGYDIPIKALKAAMVITHAEQLYGNRVSVSAPWANPCNISELARELKVSNDTQQKQLAASQKQIAQLQQRTDPTEQLKQMKHYRDTVDQLVEECVTQAVAEELQDAEVILPTHYTFKGAAGGLDGLVAGVHQGQAVVVLVEAMHNMDANWKRAKDE